MINIIQHFGYLNNMVGNPSILVRPLLETARKLVGNLARIECTLLALTLDLRRFSGQ